MNNGQNQQEPIDVTAFVLDMYEEKRLKGIITYEWQGEQLFLVHKQLNAAHEEIEPLRVPFSKESLEGIKRMLSADVEKRRDDFRKAEAMLKTSENRAAQLTVDLESDYVEAVKAKTVDKAVAA